MLNSFYNILFPRPILLTRSHTGRRGRDRMVAGFTTSCAISAYHHESCELESHSWWGVLYTTICDKVCQWLATGRWFSSGTTVSSTNKNWLPQYSWNIVESGVKHHHPLDTTLCDKVCQWLVAGLWFSLGTLISSSNNTDCHDITEILLRVELNTITLTPNLNK
jgi:hypothetical protein